MNDTPISPVEQGPDEPMTGSFALRVGAYCVHVLTASGIACAFFALVEIASLKPDPRVVFFWLAVQVFIDAIDGPFARRFKVKLTCPQIDGRTIDDLVDYNTYTLVPLLLVWRMQWLPSPGAAWIVPAMMASLFGFANRGAKDEQHGFFLGFPSYWNIVALYIGAWHAMGLAPWISASAVALCTILTLLPVRFVYPNLAPSPWRLPTLIGAIVWTALIAWIVVWYDHVPNWLMALSLIYPAAYIALSVWLDLKLRRTPGR